MANNALPIVLLPVLFSPATTVIPSNGTVAEDTLPTPSMVILMIPSNLIV